MKANWLVYRDEWFFEDCLPCWYPYDEMYKHSKIRDGVRMFPKVERLEATMLPELQRAVDEKWLANVRRLLKSHMQLLSMLNDKIDTMSPTSLEHNALLAWLRLDRDLLTSIDSELTRMCPDLRIEK